MLTMASGDRKFQRELERLSAAFVDELPVRVQSVSDDMTAWLSSPDEDSLYERLSHKVHQLKGAGSTFGCPGISEAARALELRLANCRKGSRLDELAVAMHLLQDEATRLHARRGR
jgi:chemotaxis protein histidine kinase CheA